MISKLLQQAFGQNNELKTYATAGNPSGDDMLDGEDLKIVSKMLRHAIENGVADSDGASLIKIGEYKGHSVFEHKAVDQIQISINDDGQAYVKLIVRKKDPGMGLAAFAGGRKDEGESDEVAAEREGSEEAKSKKGKLIAKYKIDRHPVAGDVRVKNGNDRAEGVELGDITAISTAAIIIVEENVHDGIQAGDDAAGAGWVLLSTITNANLFSIKDHAEMLVQATELAGVDNQLPESFYTSLLERKDDIARASPELQGSAKLLVTGYLSAELGMRQEP
ncbi:MAG: hypothetical protein GC136_09265 [Alphaproteobacteria bacterium]|nr:hypothetical protein [Alphaproteobacteria bacterium]